MSETKFTPGPWVTERRTTKDGSSHHTIGVTRDAICGVFGTHSSGRYMCVTGCIDEHDAALIAAAPDLYEALQAMLSATASDGADWSIEYRDARRAAYDALKKARGET